MSMDEANFLLIAKRVKVKDTGVVLAKGPSILKLDNLSLGIYSICCNMMCEWVHLLELVSFIYPVLELMRLSIDLPWMLHLNELQH